MSWQGAVESVHFSPTGGGPMQSPGSIHAIAGKGIEGDRYCVGIEKGEFSHIKAPRRQVTLFEREVLDTILRDHKVSLAADECRMNIVTFDVPLTHLVDKQFRVGNVVLRGLKLNEPCSRLKEVTGKRVIAALIHRCGLFAEIIESGEIQGGDKITPL